MEQEVKCRGGWLLAKMAEREGMWVRAGECGAKGRLKSKRVDGRCKRERWGGIEEGAGRGCGKTLRVKIGLDGGCRCKRESGKE